MCLVVVVVVIFFPFVCVVVISLLKPTDKDVEWADRDKLDWSVVLDGGDLDEKGIPLSWLSVDNEADGRQWYKKHTKMPDSMIDYVARYYWGDGLVPQEAASTTKVGRKKKGATPKFECHKGSFLVEF